MARAEGRTAFGIDAAGYHAGRMGYPDELFDALFARCDAAPDILEIGAGTGHATLALLTQDTASLLAIEPDLALVEYLRATVTDTRSGVPVTAISRTSGNTILD